MNLKKAITHYYKVIILCYVLQKENNFPFRYFYNFLNQTPLIFGKTGTESPLSRKLRETSLQIVGENREIGELVMGKIMIFNNLSSKNVAKWEIVHAKIPQNLQTNV